ncbi:MAG TPA: tRNA lysidine(34) synthetase TilS [Nitrosomonas sp.]|nr:tRNA lysidine(34) synthetase TilS [Nitrosomonas sp.]HRB46607.1 tRNA lysidine(34) synthetase TilS [Nitrosomonas sp.]HRB77573.1 tRNA lysidine(34) synthetase TilS [Nitrosomonas sp.]
MDLSKKPESGDFLFAEVQKVLQQHIKQGDHVCVALSGGIDSVALLDLLANFSKPMQFSLSTVHVNHGISGNATTWSQFCSKLALSYGIAIEVAYLHVQKERGVSLEASAREQRYRIFSNVMADYVVLAQHLDDQAETLLLQLLRGAGVKGLSAMPVVRQQRHVNQAKLLRPLLNVSRHQIEQYAQSKDLTWIIDESNDDTNYDRNFLRHDVLPILKKRYGSYAKTFTRASRHLSEASTLLDELAEIDRERCLISGRLSLQCLRQLSISRAKNLLRHMLVHQGIPLPSTTKLENLTQQLLSMREDHQFRIEIDKYQIHCFKGAIYFLARQSPQWITEKHLATSFIWNHENQPAIQWGNGSVHFAQLKNQGIACEKIIDRLLTIRLRAGGESFKPVSNRARRSLKNLLQEACIPPWERKRLPLLFCEDQLIWVPGVGIACEFQVKSEETGVLPSWNAEDEH